MWVKYRKGADPCCLQGQVKAAWQAQIALLRAEVAALRAAAVSRRSLRCFRVQVYTQHPKHSDKTQTPKPL